MHKKIKFYSDGEFAGYIINQELLDQANAKHTDVEGFTDFVRSINPGLSMSKDGIKLQLALLGRTNEINKRYHIK